MVEFLCPCCTYIQLHMCSICFVFPICLAAGGLLPELSRFQSLPILLHPSTRSSSDVVDVLYNIHRLYHLGIALVTMVRGVRRIMGKFLRKLWRTIGIAISIALVLISPMRVVYVSSNRWCFVIHPL